MSPTLVDMSRVVGISFVGESRVVGSNFTGMSRVVRFLFVNFQTFTLKVMHPFIWHP